MNSKLLSGAELGNIDYCQEAIKNGAKVNIIANTDALLLT
jgi:hypothetical protein